MEARLQAQLAELSGDTPAGATGMDGKGPRKGPALSAVSRREFERKLAHLQHSISELSDSHGGGSAAAAAAAAALTAWMPGSAAFRSLACDAPLGGAGGGAGSSSTDSRRFLTSRGSTVASFLQHSATDERSVGRLPSMARSAGCTQLGHQVGRGGGPDRAVGSGGAASPPPPPVQET